MEKVTLNNQIVQCRAAIRRARVCIIRKKIKKLKILKSCKKVEEKEKKEKKSERLLEEILLLKKVKEDDVTKFALQQSNITEIIQKTPVNDHEHVYAVLANHADVRKQLEKVKKDFPDSDALIKLLQSLGTRSLLKKSRKIDKGFSLKSEKREKFSKVGSDSDEVELTDTLIKTKKKLRKQKSRESDLEPEKLQTNTKIKIIERIKPEPEEKVDDPFFVCKKVAVPKLIMDEVKENPQKEIKFSHNKSNSSAKSKHFNNNKPIQNRKSERSDTGTYTVKPLEPPTPPVEEKLHPSWAAKKIKLIQPFQGTKIKFDD